MNDKKVISSVYGENGYSLDITLSASDLEMFRRMIQMQWLYRLQTLVPKFIQQFAKSGIERYHEFAYLIDHSQTWSKTTRVLPRESVNIIQKMDFYQQIEQEFGEIKISDEEKLGWENIYWRLVRPGKEDFGSLHTENWFVNLGYYGNEINDETSEKIKIWIPIYSCPGKNGLIVVPKSHHKKNWRWHAIEKYGQKKPVIDENVSQLDVQLLVTEPGRAVIFHYDLLHGGAENRAEATRVSVEFTFLVNKKVLEKYL